MFEMGHTKIAVAALALAVTLAAARAFQGMATPGIRAAAVKTVRSDLPPIRVDFRDVATEAGLTALDVSGSVESKKYILEATGHGVVIFDPKKQVFWILPGDSSGLVYLNGEIVHSPTPINRDDILEIGQTKLVLIPFCGLRPNSPTATTSVLSSSPR